MKIKTFAVLLLGLLWGTGSWYWYTCQVKGFCGTQLSTLIHSAAPSFAGVSAPADSAAEQTSATVAPAPEQDADTTNNESSASTADKNQAATAEKTADNPDNNNDQQAEKVVQSETEETTSPEEPAPEPEPDPTPIDNDSDGIPNAAETKLGLDANNPDTDGDGVNDFLETGDDFSTPLDTDNDGIINALDEDDDGDGDPTANEMPDPDNNGDPDDAQDIDDNQIPDYLDPAISRMAEDDDGDGLNNGQEKRLGSNPTLTDSDGDGLSDPFEAIDERDSDADGTIDMLDPDDDDDGIMTVMENADPNGDGNPDDALDSNSNGLPDYLDTDNTPTELPGQSVADGDTATEDGEKPAETDDNTDQTEAAEQQDEKPETDPAATSEEPAAEVAKDQTTETEQETAPAEEEDNSNKVTLDTSEDEPESGSIRKARLYFPFRSAEPELADDVVDYFDLIIKQLKDNPDTEIRVTGHTDSVGRGAANRRLGQERAEQVRDMLVKQGAPEAQILVGSKGEGEPIADNQTDAGRKKNRRVEIEPVKE